MLFKFLFLKLLRFTLLAHYLKIIRFTKEKPVRISIPKICRCASGYHLGLT